MNQFIATSIKSAGFEKLLQIQEDCIAAFQEESNVILLSKTGSGKTLAFLLSMLTKLDKSVTNEVQAVILSPTRELALQIEEVFKSLKTDLKVTTCYGGHSMRTETNSLSETPTVIIATPGRLTDHIHRSHVDLSTVKMLIVDEFDKCLEFGFTEDIQTIYTELTSLKQHLFTSATRIDSMPRFLNMAKPITIDNIKNDTELDLKEYAVQCEGDQEICLENLINSFGYERNMIFVNYREVVDDIADKLIKSGIKCSRYHGGLEQDIRERELIKFSNGSANTIVCTDLGSRGLDIPEVKHIVHYQYPSSEDAFTHRKGRTARMNESGFSYLFISEETTLPVYIKEPSEKLNVMHASAHPPLWDTIYISGGKKQKIGKIDIVGFLSKIGMLGKDDVGIIHVKDHRSYVAIKRSKVAQVLKNIDGQKIKGKRMKIQRSK